MAPFRDEVGGVRFILPNPMSVRFPGLLQAAQTRPEQYPDIVAAVTGLLDNLRREGAIPAIWSES